MGRRGEEGVSCLFGWIGRWGWVAGWLEEEVGGWVYLKEVEGA